MIHSAMVVSFAVLVYPMVTVDVTVRSAVMIYKIQQSLAVFYFLHKIGIIG